MESMPLKDVWDTMDKTEELLFGRRERSTQLFRNTQKPENVHAESIAFRLHRVCHEYYRKSYPEIALPLFREDTESVIWNFYYPQVWTLAYSRPSFVCQPYRNLPNAGKSLRVHFQLNYERGFLPYKWEWIHHGKMKTLQESTRKNGIVDLSTEYSPTRPNCIQGQTQDSNLDGRTDIWFVYQDCQLVQRKEDYDGDGKIERTCHYRSGKETCEGVGEDTRKLGQEALQRGDRELYKTYLQKGILEYTQAFGENPRHICENLFELLKWEYDAENYSEVLRAYDGIQKNPHCYKETLKSEYFTGYVNLYVLNNPKEAAKQYERANQAYKEESGWESLDMNLSLGLAYLLSDQPFHCILAIQRIEGRPFNAKGKYYFHYYRGSCLLALKQYELSLKDLEIARQYVLGSEEKKVLDQKLRKVRSALPNESAVTKP